MGLAINADESQLAHIRVQVAKADDLCPQRLDVFQKQILVGTLAEHFDLAVNLQHVQFFTNIRNAFVAEIIRGAFEQRRALSLQRLSPHKVERDVLRCDFSAHDSTRTLGCIRHG